MGNQSKQDHGKQKQMNDYERAKFFRVKANQERLKELGVANIANSLTSLAQSKKKKKSKHKASSNENEGDCISENDDNSKDYDNQEINTSAPVGTKKRRPQYIAPMSMNRYANLAKKNRVIAPKESAESLRQSSLTETTMLKRKRSSNQLGAANLNLTKPNSSGTKRKFLIDEDDDPPLEEMNEEQHCYLNEYLDGAEYENEDLQDGAFEEEDHVLANNEHEFEDEERSVQPNDGHNVNKTVDMEEEGVEYEEEDHIIINNDIGNEDQIGANIRKKRVRGPTRMKKVWGESEIIKVQFNEFGQPIDDKKASELTHFLGTIARSGKYCPIYKPWPKVSTSKKQALIELLKTKFDIPSEAARDWILSSIGQKVRNWRGRLKESFDSSLSLREQLKSKPKRVHKRQWKKLVNYWNEESSKKLSRKNQESRAQKKMIQVTGKKSYARVREELKNSLGHEPSRMEMFRACFSKDGTAKNKEAKEAIEKMEEKVKEVPEGSIDKPGPEDTFSKVIGSDKNGLARMYGLGVRARDVWGVSTSRSACLKENINLNIENGQLQAQLSEYKGKEQQKQVSDDHRNNNSSVSLRVGAEVYLKNILNSTETVAQDAVGASTAWPSTFISVIPEEGRE